MRLTAKLQNACTTNSVIATPERLVWKVEMPVDARRQSVPHLAVAAISEKRIFVIGKGEVMKTSPFLRITGKFFICSFDFLQSFSVDGVYF